MNFCPFIEAFSTNLKVAEEPISYKPANGSFIYSIFGANKIHITVAPQSQLYLHVFLQCCFASCFPAHNLQEDKKDKWHMQNTKERRKLCLERQGYKRQGDDVDASTCRKAQSRANSQAVD
eukprot:1161533-Pelagomonas_calceolata.AAC.8